MKFRSIQRKYENMAWYFELVEIVDGFDDRPSIFFFFIEKNTLDRGYLIARRHAHTFTRNQNYSSSIHSTCNSIKHHV